MSAQVVPSPAPWMPVWAPGNLVMVVSTGGARAITVAACDGSSSDANAALICAAPEMAAAVLAGDLPSAVAALTSRGLA